MANSKLAEQFRQGRSLLDDILDEDVGRLERAGPRDREGILRDWADLAKAEAAVKERYRGRYLFELIQNANDAVVDAQEEAGLSREHHPVRLVLTEMALLVANYGKPFDQNNVRALCRLHNTTKSASKRIGHKGIGFKSVLEITSRPEVYSDSFAFGYDDKHFPDDVRRVMGSEWVPDTPLSILRVPYPRYINRLSPSELDNIEALFDDDYVTVIRLPLDDPETRIQVEERLCRDIQPSLLLFMPAISQIEMRFPDGQEIAYWRHVSRTDDPDLKVVSLYSGEETLDSRWLMLGPIELPLKDDSLVKELDEAWHDVTALRFALAFPLADGSCKPGLSDDAEHFYVYYPTEEHSGLRFAIHADFYVGDDRKTLAPGRLNDWLVEEICAFLAGEGIELLKKRWPHSVDLVELLAPISRPVRDFSKAFMRLYLEYLGVSPFVPIEGQQYKAPPDTRFPPEWANEKQFRRLFPASRLRGTGKWAYPTEEVVEWEKERSPSFLLADELGGARVTPKMIVDSLESNDMPPLEGCFNLIGFLADWHDNMRRAEKRHFEALLEDIPVFPTTSGWKVPSIEGAIVFQADLRPDRDPIETPAGFEFSVIPRSVYPENGRRSNQYKLFQILGARDYARRDLVRDAILPVLTNLERFEALLAEHPTSVFGAYRMLMAYFASGATKHDMEERLARVPVPAIVGQRDGWSGWKEARECYLGEGWLGGKILKDLYAGFDDCFFLADIAELDIGDDETSRRVWTEFFTWLGVMDFPRVNTAPHRISRDSPDPFWDSLLWPEYSQHNRGKFKCAHPDRGDRHGYSRSLSPVHSVHHFAEIVREGDHQKLLGLYGLLAEGWESRYGGYCRATLRCERATASCPYEEIEDYLLYSLRHAAWLPALSKGVWLEPIPPHQVWVLGETEPVVVRDLVPTLPKELHSGSYRVFGVDLGFVSSSTAQIEDYIRLLQLLPERYPLEPLGLAEEKKKAWQQSVRTVYNWICERIQTGLGSRGDDNRPICPADLHVLACREENLCFLPVSSLDLVYPDHAFMAKRWKPHCAYIQANDDWGRLRKWLGVQNLSDLVRAQWLPEGELVAETMELQRRFEATLPYFLALIKHYQQSRYDGLVSQLERLRVHVVKHLTVKETIERLPDVGPISCAEKVYLAKADDPSPSGRGYAVKKGELYVTREVRKNLDRLGDYIADYIEILRLADAFVILINRDSDAGKRRFLESKGVSVDRLEDITTDQAAEQQAMTEPRESDLWVQDVLADVMQGRRETKPTPPRTPDAGQERDEPAGAPAGGEKAEQPQAPAPPGRPRYPPLHLDAPADVIFVDVEIGARPSSHLASEGRAGGGTWQPVPEEVRKEVGRRGEEWAFQAERNRLKALGYDPAYLEEMDELVWVARDKPTADHDIRSIRGTGDDKDDRVFIEVKSSGGDAGRVKISLSELDLAFSKGADYWLFYVANVDEARPDPPRCYRNLAELIRRESIDMNVDTLIMTLPR